MEQKDSAERILKQIPYEIVYSARKTLAVQVKADGSVVVRAPKRMAKYKIEAFLKEKQDWIHTHREKALAAAEQKAANRLTEAERKQNGQIQPECHIEYTDYEKEYNPPKFFCCGRNAYRYQPAAHYEESQYKQHYTYHNQCSHELGIDNAITMNGL